MGLRLHGDLFAQRQQIELQLNLGYNGGLQPEQEQRFRIAQKRSPISRSMPAPDGLNWH